MLQAPLHELLNPTWVRKLAGQLATDPGEGGVLGGHAPDIAPAPSALEYLALSCPAWMWATNAKVTCPLNQNAGLPLPFFLSWPAVYRA